MYIHYEPKETVLLDVYEDIRQLRHTAQRSPTDLFFKPFV